MAESSSGLNNKIQKQTKKCSELFTIVKTKETELTDAKSNYTKAKSILNSLIEQQNRMVMVASNKSIDKDWVDKKFPWSDACLKLLVERFAFKEFRAKQLAAINATLSKRDVLVVMPTGGGKSLIYQVAALADKGLTLVVSPLLSLIEDQLIAAKKFKIPAASISSGTAKEAAKEVYDQLSAKTVKLKLLYVTPEWMANSKRFMLNLKKAHEAKQIARVAVDEVHCCSSWGHDFRPDFAYLGILRQVLAGVPFIGLTATATFSVLNDIQTMLNLENCMVITAPFNRPNLYYEVVPKPSKEDAYNFLARLLQGKYKNQSGIIYVNTVTDCQHVATELRKSGVSVAPYNASMESDARKKIHGKWLTGTYQAVVATVAFGMGIDNPDVRFVIHYSIPKSIETLYQESGRAGRDGKPADCILLYCLGDYLKILAIVSSLKEEKNVKAMLEYCLDPKSCRRELLSKHFEEAWDPSHCNKMCDRCKIEPKDFFYYDVAQACDDIHDIIAHCESIDEKLTLLKLLDAWLQTGVKKLRLDRLQKPIFSRQQAEFIVSFLIANSYIVVDKGYSSYTTICYLKKGKELPKNEKLEILTSEKLIGFVRRPLEFAQLFLKRPRFD